jgi:hypothetical protein
MLTPGIASSVTLTLTPSKCVLTRKLTLGLSEYPLHGRKICKFLSPSYLLRRVKNGKATKFN